MINSDHSERIIFCDICTTAKDCNGTLPTDPPDAFSFFHRVEKLENGETKFVFAD